MLTPLFSTVEGGKCHDVVDTVKSKARISRIFGTGLTALLLVTCSHSDFEDQHTHSLLENPPGVELEIRVRDGRTQFARSETVQFEEIYTAKYSGAWHIEILDGWNVAGISDVVHITDGKTIRNEIRQPGAGIICCDSRHVWLSLDPVRLPYKPLADHARISPKVYVAPQWYALRLPEKPGKYKVYVTTERVFRRSDSTKTYHDKGIPVSSNILKVEVQ